MPPEPACDLSLRWPLSAQFPQHAFASLSQVQATQATLFTTLSFQTLDLERLSFQARKADASDGVHHE
jgi:hypothetical protein